MGDFEKAITTVLNNEGGFSNNKNDPGGATNYGVSLRFLRSTGEYGDIDGDGDIDQDDIKMLTQEKAKELYRREFWDKYHYGMIFDDKTATKIFDIAVNCGPGTAARLIQKAVNSIRQADKEITLIKVDGVMGPKTIEAINACGSKPLLSALVFFQKNYYRDLCENNEKLNVFLNGWLKRADKI